MVEYWQIAAGDTGRNYTSLFLDHGIAFVGGEANVGRIRSVRAGDRLLLKRGTSKLVAVGEVVEHEGRTSGNAEEDNDPQRQWLLDFDGWELPGWCHVRWHALAEQMPVNGLRQGTIFRIPQPHLRELADKLLRELLPHERKSAVPLATEPVADEHLLRRLVERGLRVTAAEDLTRQLARIRLLANYYHNLKDRSVVKEHETRTFLVVPLLLALGWAEQQLKVELRCEGGKVDVACFRDPFTGEGDEAVLLIETKGMGQGLDGAPSQAERYAKCFPSCNLLLVTDGVYYRAYARVDGGGFTAIPIAYLNIRSPTLRYPLNAQVAGALEAIEFLLPNVAARQRPVGSLAIQSVA